MTVSRTAAIALLLGVSACDGPSLTIELLTPTELTEELTRTVVTAYLSETLTCDAIAFGDVEAADLDAARIQEIDVAQTSTLADLPRLGRKLVVARSFIGERGDVPAVAGCAEVGDIAGPTAAKIDGQLVASVALGGELGAGTFADRHIGVDVDQPSGAPIAGREVRWTTIGPVGSFGGANQSTSVQAGVVITTDDRGRAEVTPAESDVFGPMVARVAVAWADRPLPLVQGFVNGDHARIVFDASGNTPNSPPTCVTRRRGGIPTVACLIAGQSSRRVVEFSLNGANTRARNLSVPELQNAFSLVTGHGGDGDTDSLYALLDDGRWLGLDGTVDGATADLCRMQNGSCTVRPTRSVMLPGCNGDASHVVIELAQDDGMNRFETFTETGIPVRGLAMRVRRDLRVVSAGCVGYGDALTEALVMTSAAATNGQNLVYVDCGRETACSAAWLGPPIATFAPGPSPGDVSRLIGSVTDITGPVIVEWILAPDVDRSGVPTVMLHERRRTPAAESPVGIVAGHYDADNAIDLAWSVVSGDNLQRTRVQFALAPQAAGQRLTGLTRRLQGGAPLALITIDLDCDGRDDIVSVSEDSAHIFRTGVPVVGPPPPSGC